MRKFLIVPLSVVMVLFCSSAFAGPYISGNIGYAILQDSDWSDPDLGGETLTVEYDGGIAATLAAGYDFGMFRAEVEGAYQKNDLSKLSYAGYSADISGDVDSYAGFLNGYFDFHNSSPVTPFIGGGFGFAKIEANDFTITGSGIPAESYDDTVFAYHGDAGIGIAVTQKMTIDVRYRYFATDDPEFETSTFEYSSHNIYAGLRYSF